MRKVTIEDVVAWFNKPVTLNEHGCWLWLGSTDKRGYARAGEKLAHAIVCRWAGKICIGPDAELCHICPNKNCVNPDHFYIGTHKQNMNDDNRQRMGPKGKLTQEQVVDLNMMLLKGIPKHLIAHHFDLSPAWITKFLRGEVSYAKPYGTPE